MSSIFVEFEPHYEAVRASVGDDVLFCRCNDTSLAVQLQAVFATAANFLADNSAFNCGGYLHNELYFQLAALIGAADFDEPTFILRRLLSQVLGRLWVKQYQADDEILLKDDGIQYLDVISPLGDSAGHLLLPLIENLNLGDHVYISLLEMGLPESATLNSITLRAYNFNPCAEMGIFKHLYDCYLTFLSKVELSSTMELSSIWDKSPSRGYDIKMFSDWVNFHMKSETDTEKPSPLWTFIDSFKEKKTTAALDLSTFGDFAFLYRQTLCVGFHEQYDSDYISDWLNSVVDNPIALVDPLVAAGIHWLLLSTNAAKSFQRGRFCRLFKNIKARESFQTLVLWFLRNIDAVNWNKQCLLNEVNDVPTLRSLFRHPLSSVVNRLTNNSPVAVLNELYLCHCIDEYNTLRACLALLLSDCAPGEITRWGSGLAEKLMVSCHCRRMPEPSQSRCSNYFIHVSFGVLVEQIDILQSSSIKSRHWDNFLQLYAYTTSTRKDASNECGSCYDNQVPRIIKAVASQPALVISFVEVLSTWWFSDVKLLHFLCRVFSRLTPSQMPLLLPRYVTLLRKFSQYCGPQVNIYQLLHGSHWTLQTLFHDISSSQPMYPIAAKSLHTHSNGHTRADITSCEEDEELCLAQIALHNPRLLSGKPLSRRTLYAAFLSLFPRVTRAQFDEALVFLHDPTGKEASELDYLVKRAGNGCLEELVDSAVWNRVWRDMSD